MGSSMANQSAKESMEKFQKHRKATTAEKAKLKAKAAADGIIADASAGGRDES